MWNCRFQSDLVQIARNVWLKGPLKLNSRGDCIAVWNYLAPAPLPLGSINLLDATVPGACIDATPPRTPFIDSGLIRPLVRAATNAICQTSRPTSRRPTPEGTPRNVFERPAPSGAGTNDVEAQFVNLPLTWTDSRAWDQCLGLQGEGIVQSEVNAPPALSPGTSLTFHANTQLADGRCSLLVDPGSKGNLGGVQNIRRAALEAKKHGKEPTVSRRDKPLNVMGVGNGSQQCAFDSTTPIALQTVDGRFIDATYTAPIVGEDSELPMLLGLQTLRQSRALLDMVNLRLYFLGPDGADIKAGPGSNEFQLEISPSGHLVLPTSNFEAMAAAQQNPQLDESVLALTTQPGQEFREFKVVTDRPMRWDVSFMPEDWNPPGASAPGSSLQ